MESGEIIDHSHGHGRNVSTILEFWLPGVKFVAAPISCGCKRGVFQPITNIESVHDAIEWVMVAHDELLDEIEPIKLGAVCLAFSTANEVFATDSIFTNSKMKRLVAALAEKRIAFVAGAGNDGAGHDEKKEGMGFPAILRKCISVGATEVGRGVHIAPFSNRLLSSTDVDSHTTLFATGSVNIYDGIHGENFKGTSAATPFVAAAVLAVQQQYYNDTRTWPTVDEVTQILRKHSDPIDNPNNPVRVVNILNAVSAVSQSTGMRSTV